MTDNRKNGLSIGIDLGGTKIAAGLCSKGKILKKVVIPTNAKEGQEAILKSMAKACLEVLGEAKSRVVAGIGVGAAGQIDPKSGDVIYAPNLMWKNVPLGKELSRQTSLPVKVLNDVRAATLAELKYGAGKGLKNFINVFIGTGIGSGIVFNGKLQNGATNSAGEIGHICLDPEGPLCGCGKKGCFEAFSSGRGLENHVKALLIKGKKSRIQDLVNGEIDKVTGPIIGQAARLGDPLALEALRRVGRYLGLAFANIHTLLNPDKILLGGGLMALKEFFMPDLEAAVHHHILPVAFRDDLFALAKFENDAVLLGGSAIFA